MSTNCPKGQILRKGYVTKRGVRVSPSCIKDRGKQGKGPAIIPKLKKGSLSTYGYNHTENSSNRHVALGKAVRAHGAGKVVLKLNAICVLNRNTNPSMSKKFCADKRWVQKTYSV